MKFGAVFPTCEIGTDPVAIRDFAQTAEGLGYDDIVIYDHVLGAVHQGRDPMLFGPYTEDTPFHEPFVLFGYLAAITTTIELAVGVLVLPQRQTALVAKQAAELSLLSQGRFRLGVGTGWNYVEYESLGETFAGRGKRMDEQIELLRRLWSEHVIDFDGKYHRVDRAGILPRPEAPIPIWMGGGTDAALKRAARTGDGFLAGTSGYWVEQQAAALPELLAAEGRDIESFGMEAMVDWSKGPAVWVEELERWEKLGGTHYSMRAMSTAATFLGVEPSGFTTPAEHIKALETFMNAVR
jgi:probable F420-dependent oxidoreductase